MTEELGSIAERLQAAAEDLGLTDAGDIDVDALVSRPGVDTPVNFLHVRRVRGGPANHPRAKALLDGWKRCGELFVCPAGSNVQPSPPRAWRYAAQPSFAERIHCFSSGCSCVGVTVTSPGACTASHRAAYAASYGCSVANQTVLLPSEVRDALAQHRTACACEPFAPRLRARS